VKKMIVGLTHSIEKLESNVNQFIPKESSQLHAQTVINVSVITLKTGKQGQGLEDAQEDEDKENKVAPIDKNGGLGEPTQVTFETPTPTNDSKLVSSNSSSKKYSSSYSPTPLYLNCLKPKIKR